MNNKILLVEDDPSLGYLLSEYLTFKGFEVDWKKNGSDGLKAIQQTTFDLCIFDVMMPQMDGFELAGEIKKINPSLPFIFLTSKSMKIDVLKGLSLGAEDYIKKPVDEEELVLRIEVVLRRSKNPVKNTGIISVGKYSYHTKNQQLISPTQTIQLTIREHELLSFFLENQGQLCHRKEILNRFWDSADYFNRKSMDVFISKLRKYLAEDDTIELKNVHGKGFILEVHEP